MHFSMLHTEFAIALARESIIDPEAGLFWQQVRDSDETYCMGGEL